MLYVPALQFVNMTLPLPGPQNEPAGHGRHADMLFFPLNTLYVPAWQSMQADEEVLPFDGLYVPARQLMQADGSDDPLLGLNVPALQFVNIALPLPGPQNDPVGHCKHADMLLDSIAGLYVPKLQFVGTVLPLLGPQNEPAGHGVQVTWSLTGLKKPGAHGEHLNEPMIEWDPAGHDVNMSAVLTTMPLEAA